MEAIVGNVLTIQGDVFWLLCHALFLYNGVAFFTLHFD